MKYKWEETNKIESEEEAINQNKIEGLELATLEINEKNKEAVLSEDEDDPNSEDDQEKSFLPLDKDLNDFDPLDFLGIEKGSDEENNNEEENPIENSSFSKNDPETFINKKRKFPSKREEDEKEEIKNENEENIEKKAEPTIEENNNFNNNNIIIPKQKSEKKFRTGYAEMYSQQKSEIKSMTPSFSIKNNLNNELNQIDNLNSIGVSNLGKSISNAIMEQMPSTIKKSQSDITFGEGETKKKPRKFIPFVNNVEKEETDQLKKRLMENLEMGNDLLNVIPKGENMRIKEEPILKEECKVEEEPKKEKEDSKIEEPKVTPPKETPKKKEEMSSPPEINDFSLFNSKMVSPSKRLFGFSNDRNSCIFHQNQGSNLFSNFFNNDFGYGFNNYGFNNSNKFAFDLNSNMMGYNQNESNIFHQNSNIGMFDFGGNSNLGFKNDNSNLYGNDMKGNNYSYMLKDENKSKHFEDKNYPKLFEGKDKGNNTSMENNEQGNIQSKEKEKKESTKKTKAKKKEKKDKTPKRTNPKPKKLSPIKEEEIKNEAASNNLSGVNSGSKGEKKGEENVNSFNPVIFNQNNFFANFPGEYFPRVSLNVDIPYPNAFLEACNPNLFK
ncbi:MAG: hypothetical protein MJ252_08135 [archaeon]|nr:hypothetical protein [archaeon]